MNRREALALFTAAATLPRTAFGIRTGAAHAGLSGPIGARPDAQRMQTLRITKPGVYENLLIDGEWTAQDLVKITSDNVVLRNCTIRHATRDGVEVYGQNVRIENCHIHHLINGTFKADKNLDSHGITGRPLNLTVRNCEISHVTGDAIQFDPGRKAEPWPWDNVLVDHCFMWTGPLDRDCAGYKKGEIPGENAFDSKTVTTDPRKGRVTFRNCLMKGWGHGAIGNGAALNLKERVQAVVDECVFVDNDIAFRCRGSLGSAWVTVRNCTVYRTSRVFRLEANVQNLKIFNLALGEGIGELYDKSPGAGAGFEEYGSREAPPLAPPESGPWKRLLVGEVIPPGSPGTPPSFADANLVTAIATGWEGQPPA